MTGKIAEIFESIQGEGLYFGERQVFVRFFGCNLKCRYCDTKLENFCEMEPAFLLQQLKPCRTRCHFVSFTGGEPLLQKDFLKEVLPLARQAGFKNYLETNGSLPEALDEVIDKIDVVAMDIKLPSSTSDISLWQLHRQFLRIAVRKEVFIKSVICETTTEDDLRQGLRILKEVDRSTIMVLQPDSRSNGRLNEKIERFRQICADDNVLACVIPQIHKQLGIR